MTESNQGQAEPFVQYLLKPWGSDGTDRNYICYRYLYPSIAINVQREQAFSNHKHSLIYIVIHRAEWSKVRLRYTNIRSGISTKKKHEIRRASIGMIGRILYADLTLQLFINWL